MKRKFPLYPLLLFSLIVLGSCGKQRPGFDTYDISFSEKINFDKDKRLILSDIVSDNRCPIDVDCIVPGEAVLQFTAVCDTDTILFDLFNGAASPGPKDTLIFDEYRLELLEVLPVPLAGVELEDDEYSCRLVVEKKP